MTTMSGSHNKKRNVALLFEFLTQRISRALVDDDKKASAQALRILRKHFKPGTELYKEFRLINSLLKTTVSNPSVAASILQEAKSAARAHNVAELDREKSLLIRNINHGINDSDFYDQQVNEYRMYATIQTLLNDWRTPNADLIRLASYEDQLVTWLTTEKKQVEDISVSDDSPGTSRLLMKVMMKKLNEKYTGVLNEDQKVLLRAYAFSTANDDTDSIQKKLIELKDKLLYDIDSFSSDSSCNEYLDIKLNQVKEQLLTEDLMVVDDDTVTRFMLYVKLGSEIGSEV